jgi:hypothetical protein
MAFMLKPRFFSANTLRPALLVGILALGLGSCGSTPKGLGCPAAAVLVPTSSLTTFRQGAGLRGDPAGELYTISVTSVETSCDVDAENGTSDSSLDIDFRATRVANGEPASYKVPYFVAVTQGSRVLDKRIAWIDFAFAAGEAASQFRERVDSTVVTLENGKKPYDYELLVGLQLTHDQLEYNKKMGRQ